MSADNYDPHLALAVRADLLSQEDYDFYVNFKDGDDIDRYDRIYSVRKNAKTTTYSAAYGVGKTKLAKTAGVSVKEAETLLDGFWKLNWSVKQFASEQKVKVVNGQMWVLNPVSDLWIVYVRREIFFPA